MAKYPSKGHSLWNETSKTVKRSYPSLSKDMTIDVAIIGAGIAGLTLAYLLKQRGKNVAVFEKYAIGDGVTGFTTAKVTSQHGLIYSELADSFSKETARLYGEANETAIQTIESIIKKEKIECDWRRDDNYDAYFIAVFCRGGGQVSQSSDVSYFEISSGAGAAR